MPSKWKSMVKKAKKWVRSTHPATPSFVVLYWSTERGRQSILWEGPSHMRTFAEDEVVQEKFINAALSRSVLPAAADTAPEETSEPIELFSSNPKDYRSDVLRKIIPIITNPSGSRGFWVDNTNQPLWWPAGVPFKCPNHPKRGDSKMSAQDMRKVLRAFLKSCKERYKITGVSEDDDVEIPPSDDEQSEIHRVGSPELFDSPVLPSPHHSGRGEQSPCEELHGPGEQKGHTPSSGAAYIHEESGLCSPSGGAEEVPDSQGVEKHGPAVLLEHQKTNKDTLLPKVAPTQILVFFKGYH